MTFNHAAQNSHSPGSIRACRASSLIVLVGILCAVGCRAPDIPKRPVSDLVEETLAFAESYEAREAAIRHHLRRHNEARARIASQYDPAEGDDDPPMPNADRPGRLLSLEEDESTDKEAAGPLVNEIFEETDLRQAIQSLAAQAEVSVVVDDQVGGVATAIIEDEPFEAALQKILLPLGYIWGKHQGQYLIGTTDPESAMFRFLSTKLEYRPQHFSPEELTALLPQRLQQYVRTVGKRNMMVIDAPKDIAQEIVTELRNSDEPVPQVALEAVVAVFSPETSYQYGLDLEQLTRGDNGFRVKLSGLALSGLVAPGATGELFGKFAVTSYFLRALEQEGYVKIRAAPHVVSKDGEKAEISINRETYFSTQPQNNAEFFFRQEIKSVEAGISLNITPVIRGDTVTVTIEKAEVSEDIRETGSNPELANPFPLINRRTISTTVSVKDGETIVIGGLAQQQVVDRVNRVPIIGKLPFCGRFFEQVDQQMQEAEVVVFISPRIIRPGVETEELPERLQPIRPNEQ